MKEQMSRRALLGFLGAAVAGGTVMLPSVRSAVAQPFPFPGPGAGFGPPPPPPPHPPPPPYPYPYSYRRCWWVRNIYGYRRRVCRW